MDLPGPSRDDVAELVGEVPNMITGLAEGLYIEANNAEERLFGLLPGVEADLLAVDGRGRVVSSKDVLAHPGERGVDTFAATSPFIGGIGGGVDQYLGAVVARARR